ncbi:MAG: YfhO family protein [Deltaproteobacteria bacterium]|nr:MAG: YfhO family protein [Deltaproteobacteria bacterium]
MSSRVAAAAAGLFLALSAAFQLPGTSADGLLSDASALRAFGLWAERWPPATPPDAPGDYVTLLAPYASFMQDELRAGRLPLWNPYVATGVPLVETGQPALFHPFTLLLLFVPFESALSVMAVLRLAIAGLGCFLLARLLGCRTPAAVAAGVVFMFHPFHLQTRFHPVPNASMLLPFLLAVGELRLRGGRARRLGAAWALLGALTLLAGHLQTSVYCVAAAWAYHLLRALGTAGQGGRWSRVGREAGFLAVCTGLSVLGAAALLLPHLQGISESSAAAVRSALGYRGLLPRDVPTILTTQSRGYGAYVGIAALFFAVRGAAARGRFPRLPIALVGAAAFAAAYGIWPVRSLLGSLPVVGLADHSRLLVVIHLCLALLVGAGVDAARDARSDRASLGAAAGLGLALLLLWGVGWVPGPATRLGVPTALVQPLAFLLAVGALVAAGRRWRAAAAVGWLAAALLFADAFVARGPRPRSGAAAYPPAPAALETVRAAGELDRVFIPASLLPPNANVIYRTARLDIYEPAQSLRTMRLLNRAGLPSFLEYVTRSVGPPDPSALRILNLLNVRHVIARPPLEDPALLGALEPIAAGPVAVYRNPHAFPRAFIASEARMAKSPREALRLLAAPDVDLRRTVILEERPGLYPRVFPEAPETRVRIVEYRPGDVRIDARAPEGGYLVFSESYASGWTATLDGAAVRPLRADYNLLAVPLWPGRHDVRLRYRPAPLFTGVWLSALTLPLLLAVGLLPAPRAPRRRAPDALANDRASL